MRGSTSWVFAGTAMVAMLTGAPGAAADEKAEKKAATTVEVRRDPRGIKGISPFMAGIARGREAFQQQDLEVAIALFKKALAKDRTQVLGYVLLAQAQLLNGDLEEALRTANKGAEAHGSDAEKSKLLMVRAELEERRANSPPGADNAPGSVIDNIAKKWAAAREAWKRYATYVGSHSKAPNYAGSGDDRRKKIDARITRDKDGAAMRQQRADAAKK